MERGAPFDRTELTSAFERMMTSDFRYATEDVDIAEIEKPWPLWFADVTEDIARQRGWNEDWINDAVQFHLSSLASKAVDHIEFGTFPPTRKDRAWRCSCRLWSTCSP